VTLRYISGGVKCSFLREILNNTWLLERARSYLFNKANKNIAAEIATAIRAIIPIRSPNV